MQSIEVLTPPTDDILLSGTPERALICINA